MSRSPSPVPPLRKAPVEIIRLPKKPVVSTPKKATSRTSSQRKAKAQNSTPLHPPPNPLKPSAPTQPSLPPPMAISSPPPAPFVPSNLYISMMSGLAMANMPQTMQVAAAADPMAAFQLAQMCFAPPSTFPLPPFPFVPPQPDHLAVQPQLQTPKISPKPASSSTPESNPGLIPAPPPASSPVLQDNPKLIPTPPSTSVSGPSVTTEMDPLMLKQKRQARRQNIGWIPEPGFPARGSFNSIPTLDCLHWSSSDHVTRPDPQRSLVMEDLPHSCRTIEFVRSWSDRFSATAVYLNSGGKALIEFPSREVAEEVYDSPRLRDGPYKRATHVRVFWYRPQVEGASPMSITSGNANATEEVKDGPTDTTSNKITTAPEEPMPMDIDALAPLVETTEIEKAQSKGKGKEKGSSLPPPGRDPPDINLPVRSSTVPMSASRQEYPFVSVLSKTDQGEQGQRSSPVDRAIRRPRGWSEHTPSPTSPTVSVALVYCTKVPSPRLRSFSPETIQRKRTPTESPPSLRYPSSTPEMTYDNGRVPSPSGETSAHDPPSPTSTSEPSAAGDPSLEQQLRMRLFAMKQTRITNRNSERSSPTSTPSTTVDPGPDALFKVASPPPTPQTPGGIVISDSLELLAASFITDTLQAAQGLHSEPDRFDAAMKARLSKKRGSGDAFGSSADIAFKRQRLAQQIEESKRIMERLKAAKTKEERNQIYALWEESNRFVPLTCVDCALIMLHDPFFHRYF